MGLGGGRVCRVLGVTGAYGGHRGLQGPDPGVVGARKGLGSQCSGSRSTRRPGAAGAGPWGSGTGSPRVPSALVLSPCFVLR